VTACNDTAKPIPGNSAPNCKTGVTRYLRMKTPKCSESLRKSCRERKCLWNVGDDAGSGNDHFTFPYRDARRITDDRKSLQEIAKIV
jgi:hypothetical protein